METVRKLREERGWTQAQLAVYAGMGPAAISQIETGARSPNASTLQKLAKAFGVEIPDLFERSDTPKAQAPLPFDSQGSAERRLPRDAHLFNIIKPWSALLNALAVRWEAMGEQAPFERGAFDEAIRTWGDLFRPIDQAWDRLYDESVIDAEFDPLESPAGKELRAVEERLNAAAEKLAEVAEAHFDEAAGLDSLEELREKRAELRAASEKSRRRAAG